MDVRTKIQAARAQILMQQPFFGNLLLSLSMEEDNKLNPPTMAVNGVSIFFHKQFVESISLAQTKGVLLHEILHVAYMHLLRVRYAHYDPEKANVAQDLSINWLLKKINNIDLPDGLLLDPSMKNLTWEQIYKKLPKDMDKYVANIAGPNPFRDTHMPCTEEQAQDMAKKMVQVYDSLSEKERGLVPGDLAEMIEEFKNPRIPWERLLLAKTTNIFKRTDYDCNYPSNQYRLIDEEMIFPKLVGKSNTNLVVAIDTSGSMSTDDLATIAPEMNSICKLATKSFVITCDAQVQDFMEFTEWDDAIRKVKWKGRGGTSFQPVFDEIAKRKIEPECLVFFTDGYGEQVKRPPYPVIWCITEHGTDMEGRNDFGVKIKISDFKR